jgi:hypothetical protein
MVTVGILFTVDCAISQIGSLHFLRCWPVKTAVDLHIVLLTLAPGGAILAAFRNNGVSTFVEALFFI